LQADFSRDVQELADRESRELTSADIWGAFQSAYLGSSGTRFELVAWEESRAGSDRLFVGTIRVNGTEKRLSGRGNGLMSSVIAALAEAGGPSLDIADYSEHAIGHGSDARAAAYVECRTADGRTVFGAGIDEDVATASVRAILSAANRAG
jgi:2-isopropylmalate synthase